jgi:hypothetical protein
LLKKELRKEDHLVEVNLEEGRVQELPLREEEVNLEEAHLVQVKPLHRLKWRILSKPE